MHLSKNLFEKFDISFGIVPYFDLAFLGRLNRELRHVRSCSTVTINVCDLTLWGLQHRLCQVRIMLSRDWFLGWVSKTN